jgi:hypothetical protein
MCSKYRRNIKILKLQPCGQNIGGIFLKIYCSLWPIVKFGLVLFWMVSNPLTSQIWQRKHTISSCHCMQNLHLRTLMISAGRSSNWISCLADWQDSYCSNNSVDKGRKNGRTRKQASKPPIWKKITSLLPATANKSSPPHFDDRCRQKFELDHLAGCDWLTNEILTAKIQ